MIDDIGEELDGDAETWHRNPRSFPTTNAGFQKTERNLQKSVNRMQQYLEASRNHALSQFADYEPRVVTDNNVTWLRDHDHILNLPAAGSLASRKCTSSHLAAK